MQSLPNFPALINNSPASEQARSGNTPLPIANGALVARHVQDLDLQAEVSLNSGIFKIPFDFGIAKVKIEPGTIAKLSFHIGQRQGNPIVTGAEVRFFDSSNQPTSLVVTNPAEAGRPKNGCFSGLTTWIQDLVANGYFDGIYVKDDGQIQILGEIRGLFNLVQFPIMEQLSADRLPKLQSDFTQIVNGNPFLSTPVAPEGSKPINFDLLASEITKILGSINYKMNADLDTFAVVSNDATSCTSVGVTSLHTDMAGKGRIGLLPGATPVLNELKSTIGVTLQEPRLVISNPDPLQAKSNTTNINAEIDLGRGEETSALSGKGSVTIRNDETLIRSGIFQTAVPDPVECTLNLDTLALDLANKNFEIKGVARAPDGLPSFIETMNLDLTERGGELKILGATQLDNLSYTRKFLPFVDSSRILA